MIFAVLCLIMIGLMPFTPARAQGNLGIAAVVNDEVISVLDLQARMAMIMESASMDDTPENRDRIAQPVLRGLIDEKLKLQETRRLGIQVTQADIENALQIIAGKNKMSVPQLSDHLASIGVPLSALASRLESELAWDYYIGRHVAKRLQIGEEEVKDEIERIRSQAGRPEYLISEIFVPMDAGGEQGDAGQMAQSLLLQLKNGAPFSALAENFSQAPSAAVGGDMGWLRPDTLDPTLRDVIGKLNPGEVSIPVRALGGYYLLYLREVRTNPGLQTEETMVKLSQYHAAAPAGADNEALNALGARMIEETRGMRTCSQLETHGQKAGTNLSGPLGVMKLSALPESMRGIIAGLAPGQPSRPVQTGNGLAVLMVCEKTGDQGGGQAAKDAIRTKLLQQRLEVAAERKLRDLRHEAFLDIRL
ncbi:MAG: peptidylprolyl isomerase [Alphaproteobacteria bacterium]|nr:peptidylprolyl isomerase [Alphaproteobacteria bacterium]